MLATPKLHERLLLALEAIATNFGHRQSAIAIINERDAELRIRAAIGFEGDTAQVEMPLDSSAACVRVIHDAQPLWIRWKRTTRLAVSLQTCNGIRGSGVTTLWYLGSYLKTGRL